MTSSDASMPRAGAPEAEFAIDATLVHRLLAKEQRWLPELAPRLPIAIPVAIRTGQPGPAFPWPWSIVPWFPGLPADLVATDDLPPRTFGRFLRDLHQPAPAAAPHNPVRGCALGARAAVAEARIERLRGACSFDWPALSALWQTAVAAPIDTPVTWLHGDLHPRNLLVTGSRWSAVVDWGDLGAGDPATDLAVLWLLWPLQSQRAEALAAYGSVSAATLHRARGWALLFATLMLEAGLAGDGRFAAIGAWTCARLLAA